MAQNAIKPEEIDAGAAQQELGRGQKMWNEAGEDAEKYAQANEVILEAPVAVIHREFVRPYRAAGMCGRAYAYESNRIHEIAELGSRPSSSPWGCRERNRGTRHKSV
jgi:hypothetical protein